MERIIDSKYKAILVDGGIEIVNRETGRIIPLDEPLFLIRARDICAVPAIEHYGHLASAHGAGKIFARRILAIADVFIRFAKDFGTKIPD